MNFRSLKQFLKFKIIENELKFNAPCRAETDPAATVHAPAACHVRSVRGPAGPRPGGLVQPRMRLVSCARGAVRWRAHRRLSWLASGKVLI
jgi:hypothetical protein